MLFNLIISCLNVSISKQGISDILINSLFFSEVQAKVWYTKRKKSNFTREITKETGNQKNKYSKELNQ